jgi:hypothetical protein
LQPSASPELAVSINEHGATTALIDAIYPRDVSCRLCPEEADADGVGLSGDTGVSNVDVATACSEIGACIKAQSDVLVAGCVAVERPITNGRVKAAGCIVNERQITTDGRISNAGCV